MRVVVKSYQIHASCFCRDYAYKNGMSHKSRGIVRATCQKRLSSAQAFESDSVNF